VRTKRSMHEYRFLSAALTAWLFTGSHAVGLTAVRPRCGVLQPDHALGCNDMLLDTWGYGGTELEAYCKSSTNISDRCPFLCCCVELMAMRPMLADAGWLLDYETCVKQLLPKYGMHGAGCSLHGVQLAREARQYERDAHQPHRQQRSRATEGHVTLEWQTEWRKCTVMHMIGSGHHGIIERVRFQNGFECARKTMIGIETSRKAHTEVHMQRLAATTGFAPAVLHFVNSSSSGTNQSIIFSELMATTTAFGKSCTTPNERAQVINACDEFDSAMSALDDAGIRQKDMALRHVFRNASGALKIIDFTAAKQIETCKSGTNRRDFLRLQLCYYSNAARTAGLPNADETDGRVHRLADSVFERQAAAMRFVLGRLHGQESCFASLCFPRLVRAMRRAQRRRNIGVADECNRLLSMKTMEPAEI